MGLKGNRFKKMKSKGISLANNKLFYGFFAIFFSLIILLGATSAWTSYTEWIKNHMQTENKSTTAENRKVTIDEEFVDDSVLNLTDVTEDGIQKSVKVKNASTKDAILRVKFTESIAPFEIDVTAGEGKGNGKLKIFSADPNLSQFNASDLATWKEGSQYQTPKNTEYYQVSDKVLVKQQYKGETNRMDAASPEQLKIFKWVLNSVHEDQTDLGNTAPYWVLDTSTGYFYYSKVVQAGDTTGIDLLQKVLFQSTSIGNPYKDAFYDINVMAEGVEPTTAGVESWGSSIDLLPMYQEDALFDQ